MYIDKKRELYLDGLKGWACLMILTGHYSTLLTESISDKIIVLNFKNICSTPLGIFVNANYWLQLFFVISGYLVSGKSIYSIKMLFIAIIKRFERIFIPCFWTCLIIYIIYISIGFHTSQVFTVVQNNWIAKYYQKSLHISDIFVDPFLSVLRGKSYFNSPFWCLAGMFYSSGLIYIMIWMNEKLINISSIQRCCYVIIFNFIILFFLRIFLLDLFYIAFGCCAGYWLRQYLKINNDILFLKNNFNIIILLIGILFAWWLRKYPCIISINWCLLLIICNKNKKIGSYFQNRLLLYLGRISWGIFAFHWPIFCSIGILSMIKSYAISKNLLMATIIAWLNSFIMTIFMSLGYYFLFENKSNILKNKFFI